MKRMQMMPTGRGGAGKVVGTLVLLVILALVISNPIGAAETVRHVAGALKTFSDAMSR